MTTLSLESMTTGAEGPRLYSLSDLLSELGTEAERRYLARQSGTPWGPVTGFPKLDEQFGGALPRGLHVIHAGPGVGKTALSLQIAATCGCPALYVTSEMAPVELIRRLAARVTTTFLGRFKSGEMTAKEVLDKAQEAAKAAPLLRILDATTAYPSPDYLFDVAEAVQGDSRDVLLVVDSVHTWAESSRTEASEYEVLSGAVKSLQLLAARLGAPILAITERNRNSMKDGGLHASAGGRGFEYKGESVWSLDADTETIGADRPVTVTLAKNRHASSGTKIELKFHGALQRFTEA